MSSIPLGDAAALRPRVRRYRVVRLAIAAALAGAALAAFLTARASSQRPTPLLPAGSSGIVVIDVSGSVESATLDRVYGSLSRLATSNGRFGVVVFAGRAYEALPPNTPARELAPFARFFHPLPRRSLAAGTAPAQTPLSAFYPANPWRSGFDAGTEVSSGLDLARRLILADPRTHRAVWLVSDLADDPTDLGRVVWVARQYIASDIVLHLVALNPTRSDLRFFTRLLGPRGTIVAVGPSTRAHVGVGRRFPVSLALAAAAVALVLAAAERWSTPLRFGARPEREGTVST